MNERGSSLLSWLPLLALVACAPPTTPPPEPKPSPAAAPASSGQTRMDRDEEASESIANWLLDLRQAVIEERWSDVPEFFAEDFTGERLPVARAETKPLAPGVEKAAFELPPDGKEKLNRAGIEGAFRDFFGRWSRFDHLLFKVKGAELGEGKPVRAKVKLQVQVVATRKGAGPEELFDWWKTEVVEGPDETHPWRITRIEPEAATSIVAARPFFTEVSRSTGLAKTSPRFGTEQNQGFNWHGAAAADFDQDGDIDLFVPSREGNQLYRNEADGHFADVASDAGVAVPADGTGAVWLDFDNDGDQDLFVARVGTQLLFENRLVPDRKAAFIDVSGPAHVGDRAAHGFGVAVADIDSDGWLDVFVASYNAFGEVMPSSWFDATNGTPNLLFRNQKDGTFKEVSREAQVGGNRWSYAAAFADYDSDGDPDLHVANDYGADNFYKNRGDGTFEDVAAALGLADPGNGMGVAWGDYDNDGDLDLHVMNMSSTAGTRILKRLFPDAKGVEATLLRMASGDSLYNNKGDGTFEEVGKKTGGVGAQWAWGGGFLDIDNDGFEDTYITNGFITGKSMKDT